LCKEHNIGLDGLPLSTHAQGNTAISFIETPIRYYARALFIDLEDNCISTIRKQMGKMVDPIGFVSGKEDAANNYIRAKYTIGKEIIDEALDSVRKYMQLSNGIQCFIITHSIGGGTGSGFCSLFAERLNVEYPKTLRMSISVFPSN